MDYKALLFDFLARISSRKFLLAVVGVVVVFGVDLSPAQITAITVLITAFVGAEGYADAKQRSAESI